MADNNIKYDDSGLDDLISALNKDYFVRVGILGSKASKVEHKNSKLTNAELGTIHEFGSKDGKHPPRRSFLEDSLKYKLKLNDAKMHELRKSLFKNFFEKKAPQKFLADLGAKCLLIIEEGFATNGFGMWKPLASLKTFEERYEKARRNYERVERGILKGKIHDIPGMKMLEDYFKQMMNPQILTDTGKLRKSFSFKVMRNK